MLKVMGFLAALL
jgi:hypothetical protein